MVDSYVHHLEAKELASQIVNLVIALRPEIELCYMGIFSKCFEVLENRNHDDPFSFSDSRTNSAHAGPGGVGNNGDDSDGTEDDQDDDEEDTDHSLPPANANDTEATDSDAIDDSGNDTDEEDPDGESSANKPKFKLREILFYDDKITIFKARHGRL